MKVYSTMSREKEDLKTINPGRVKLFVCGPTVYDDAHIGHGRTYISFDTIKRYLEYKGYSVFYIENITDIDDKIINRSKESGVESSILAKKYEKRFIEDMESLNVHKVNLFAHATDHIAEIINQISRLIDKGFAYITDDGVYYNINKFDDFGKLSNRNVDELESHRDIADSDKHNPNDFVLWKNREAAEFDGEPKWDSPWGKGRPGWHIEDTAITEAYFGPQYNIHGGGLDLIFPHHDAEIAQMEAASGKEPLVDYWMHTGFLNVSGEKMSKSLGNFITIKELLKNYEPEVYRYFVLSTHYRSPIDFSDEILKQSQNSLERIQNAGSKVLELRDSNDLPEEDKSDIKIDLNSFISDFYEAMDNDFNTPVALSALFDFTHKLNKSMNNNEISISTLNSILDTLNEIGSIFGLNFVPESENTNGDLSEELLNIITDIRSDLRSKKDWDTADKIRDKLSELNINLEDK